MNAELMKDLEESGGGLLPFAETLRRAPQVRVSPVFADRVMARVRTSMLLVRWLRPMPIAAAASVAAMLALAAFMYRPASLETRLVECQRADGSFSGSSAARYVQAFAVSALACAEHPDFTALGHAVDALLRSQNADGGWGGGGLSARNVAALAAASSVGVANAKAAYRRGLRYLRMNGIAELSAEELSREAKDALAKLGASRDDGLVFSVRGASRL